MQVWAQIHFANPPSLSLHHSAACSVKQVLLLVTIAFQQRLWTVLRNSGFWFLFSPQCQHRCGSQMLARTDDDLLPTTSIAPIQAKGMTGPLRIWMHYSSAPYWSTLALHIRLTRGFLLNIFQIWDLVKEKKKETLSLSDSLWHFQTCQQRVSVRVEISAHALTKSKNNICSNMHRLL